MASVPQSDFARCRRTTSISVKNLVRPSDLARPSDVVWIAKRNLLPEPFIALARRRRRLGEAAMVQMHAVLITMVARTASRTAHRELV